MRPHTPVLLCVGALSAPVLAVSDASGVYEVREPVGHRGSGPCAHAHVAALGIRLDEMPHGIAQTYGAWAQRLRVGLPRAPLERGDLGAGETVLGLLGPPVDQLVGDFGAVLGYVSATSHRFLLISSRNPLVRLLA